MDIITYSWAPKWQNLNANVIRMAKNKREKALICLEGMYKTRFADFPKSHLMFWTTGFSWGVLYLQLQPKNRKFYEVFALSFCVRKLGANRLFQRETCSRYEVKCDFWVSEAGFKKVNDGKWKFDVFLNWFRLYFVNRSEITTIQLTFKISS